MPNEKRSEFELIARIRERVRDTDPALLRGIGDDAAVFLPTSGKALVTTTDSLVAGRHFGEAWPASDIGHLALAVNLSDLAAMAATPRWGLLSLTLPTSDLGWLDGFLDGFLALAEASGTHLIGGNLAAGPLNIAVQLIGEVEPERWVGRGGAEVGDVLLLTGTVGDAAAALQLGERAPAELLQRLHRPQARLAAGMALAARATAMIDVSDGLLADLAHLLAAGQGAEIDLASLPTSQDLAMATPNADVRWPLQLSGGNDYELLLTAAAEHVAELQAALDALGLPLTEIGRVTEQSGIRCRSPDGSIHEPQMRGWDHFEH